MDPSVETLALEISLLEELASQNIVRCKIIRDQKVIAIVGFSSGREFYLHRSLTRLLEGTEWTLIYAHKAGRSGWRDTSDVNYLMSIKK